MDKDKYIGRLLDNRYEIQEVIGIGGMAVVYKARCHRLNRPVAIKILKDDYRQDEDFRRRFHAESQAVAMLSHPNIVSVYDVSSSNEADYIVMELIEGISLKQYMEMKGILNWKENLHFAMQIAKALEHAHSRGIVHRDIKPHNVMVLKNGSVKVADFGIARIMSKGNTLTKEALGSVHYISPEQAKGGRVDDRSDIYSLGVVMYEMMTGRPPYDGESPVAVAIQHINGGAAKPTTLNPNIPTGMEQIIMKAMAHDPANRYQSAGAMLYDLDEFRKDPALVFPYALFTDPITPLTVVESSGNKTPAAQSSAGAAASGMPALPRTPASRQTGTESQGAARRTGTVPQGVSRQTGNTASAAAAAQARRAAAARRRAQQKEERNNKIAVIAVIVCAVTLVLAILILVGLGLSGGSDETRPSASNTVLVGSFVGELETKIDTTDIQIIREVTYHDSYAEGMIIAQTPAAGTVIEKGDTVTITVSLGKAPQVRTMENLVRVELELAKNFLAGQGVDPSSILSWEEFSDEIEAGLIIRTEPAFGEPISEGQTVKLWYSKGPESVKAPVPNVIGRQVDVAIRVLENSGFKSVIIEPVDSSEDKDEVVGLSVTVGETIDVTTQIILQVSNGPTKPPTTVPPTTVPPTTVPPTTVPPTTVPPTTVPPTTDPPTTEPPTTQAPTEPEETTPPTVVVEHKTVTWALMEGAPEPYTLRIVGPGIDQSFTIEPGQETITVDLAGSGTLKYELYINNEIEPFDIQTVIFN